MLRLQEIRKQYESKIVLNGINSVISDESIVAVRGKNGSGKTTLLNIIGGLINFEGNVYYDDISLHNNYVKYMGNISFLSNEAFSYQYLTLMEMIELLSDIMNTSKKSIMEQNKIFELIDLLELNDFKDTLIKNLSLGTRQKVSVVTNLLDKPKVILLDEPFVNLDENSVSNLLIYLKRYIEQNKAIMIYATHSNDEKLDRFTTNELNIVNTNTMIYR
ncbi:ABC-2 type transport system ATP-binding protein [Lachnotalea glycerini]|uniref:ABC transporter ATP-binding protein n=1 Tax=Lachnotalea glycerini TaxID=1763509 RepID=A0A255IJN0_9FIRM|nr:ATP-binding cassette domain-containing protein [Lachnotalea glycerini]PXV91612.1 ABC-2 type transport system ATP-binding protein [Lachnotalea glycerini]RDY28444.1 ABC transporter ATP-binding protein [Lachnotalea glycerini]